VILPRERHEAWLDPEFGDAEKLAGMLVPYPAAEVKAYPVSTLVNSAKVEDERCVSRERALGGPHFLRLDALAFHLAGATLTSTFPTHALRAHQMKVTP
jgi:hypothetical protein